MILFVALDITLPYSDCLFVNKEVERNPGLSLGEALHIEKEDPGEFALSQHGSGHMQPFRHYQAYSQCVFVTERYPQSEAHVRSVDNPRHHRQCCECHGNRNQPDTGSELFECVYCILYSSTNDSLLNKIA